MEIVGYFVCIEATFDAPNILQYEHLENLRGVYIDSNDICEDCEVCQFVGLRLLYSILF